MATTKNKNLFYLLYSHSNDVTNSGYICSSAVDEHDTSFDISDSEALITDSNGDILSSIDLTPIHADNLTLYNSETKILQPKSAYILHGNEYGEAYKSQFFLVDYKLKIIDDYQEYCNLLFDISYHKNGKCNCIHVNTYNVRNTYGSFVNIALNQLNKLKVPISISIKTFDDTDGVYNNPEYICFQSTLQGYDFMIRNVFLLPITQDNETYNSISGEFVDSPFGSATININDILDLLNEYQPIYKDAEYPTEYNVNCDIFRGFLNISQDINEDFDNFINELNILKTYFLLCFDELGNIINDELFQQYIKSYKNIYIKYFNNIFVKYNFNDIINILEALRDLITIRKQETGSYACLEDLNKFISNYKYPNGAMRGIVIVPDWGTFDDESEKQVLLVNHIADKVEIAIPINDNRLKEYMGVDIVKSHKFTLFEKAIASVNINALIPEEKKRYINDCNNLLINDISSNEGLTTSFDRYQEAGFDTLEFVDNDLHRNPLWNTTLNNYSHIKFKDTHNHLSHKIIGLYKYMDYLNHNDLWLRVGDVYMISGIDDDMLNNAKNLLSSVLIYNPNDIPVRIKYMIFS